MTHTFKRYSRGWSILAASFLLVHAVATVAWMDFEVIRAYVRQLRNQAAQFEIEPEIRTS
jgi:hypothetical protein